MAEHNILGIKGEEVAASYLKKNGYSILEKNWRFGHKEIDIIAKKGDILVIVEIKTRRGSYMGEPEEFVSKQKQKNLIGAANSYILKNEIELETRFDIISILVSGKTYTVKHIEDAFYPTL